MRPALRLLVATLATLVALLAASCSSDRPEEVVAPEPPPPEQPDPVASRATVQGHPPEDRFESQVAYVDPDLTEVTLYRERPDPSPEIESSPESDAEPDSDPESESDPESDPSAESDADARSDADDSEPTRRGRQTRVALDEPGATITALPGPAELLGGPAPDAPVLSPIPSPGLSWGATAIDEGFSFQNPTLIGSPLAFLVVADHGEWLEVMLPARPNQQTAWVASDQVTVEVHRWRAEVDLTANRLRVWDDHELKVDTPVVSGTDDARTPQGRFYINEMQRNDPNGPYGAWILSTNGFSDVLERFSGEVPIFALHGTPYAATMGQRLSNGCIRLPNAIVEYLAAEMPVGTPVDVVA